MHLTYIVATAALAANAPFCLALLLILPSSSYASKNNYLEIGRGAGDKHALLGYRLSYRHRHINWMLVKLFSDYSLARWHLSSDFANKLKIIAIAPVIRFSTPSITKLKLTLFIEGSVGIAYKSDRHFGNNITGSRWAFQDLVGGGISFNNRFDIRLHYLHYSNAGLKRPNPGLDVKPLVTIAYKF